jgi:N-acetylmuramoyl-L-alanine amidase
MIKKIFLWGTLAFSVAVHAAGPTELREIKVSGNAAGASVALDLSAIVAPKVFRLAAPERVVIDLQRTRAGRGVRLPPPSGLIASIRTGPRPGGALRVVIQLNAAASAHTHWGTRGLGHELVIDLGEGLHVATAAVAAPPSPATAASAPPAAAAPSAPATITASHVPQDSDRSIIIAVDAGHGGDDPGAIGHAGTREKDVTLAIARALAARIDAEPGMRAVLTRDRDEFVMLSDRVSRAQQAKADLFVSVHADSIRDASVAGASVYVVSDRGATDEAARWLADRENSADLAGHAAIGGRNPDLQSVLIDLQKTQNISTSMSAAERVLAALQSIGEVRKPRVQQAGFMVLKSRDMSREMPAMLVETAYISNPQDERRLRTRAEQDKLAGAIFSGIRSFFESRPPPGTRFAQLRHALARATPTSPSQP